MISLLMLALIVMLLLWALTQPWFPVSAGTKNTAVLVLWVAFLVYALLVVYGKISPPAPW